MKYEEMMLALKSLEECGDGDVALIAHEAAIMIKYLNRRMTIITTTPSCNDCVDRKSCKHAPRWGDLVRLNCPLHPTNKMKEAERNESHRHI